MLLFRAGLLLLLAPALAFATPRVLSQTASGVQPAPAAQAPATPPFVDPATLRPKPRAADVGSIDAIVAAVYDVISGPAGPRDWDRFKSLLLPECRLMPLGHRPDGQDVYRVLDADGYIQRAGPTFSKEGFFETAVSNTVEQFGGIAHVFSTYESRHEAAAAPFARGINSMQLVKLGDRWWIASIAWDAERPGVTIPDTYLGR
jgi:hypothetical protein